MIQHITHTRLFRAIAVMVIVAFVSLIPAQSGYAQVILQMPAPGQMIHPTGAFAPAQMVGMRVDMKDPFNFYFVMDKGEKPMANDVKKTEYEKLIKYFLASLTIANDDMWVNLSPHESNRIIPDNFSQTGMGRDLLAQDYILKQFTASLMYPEDSVGRAFWDKIYAQAYQKYGTTDIPVDTFNKVWITADQADIYQKDDTAFLVKSHLKVMLEQDLMAMEQNKAQFGNIEVSGTPEANDARKMASDIVREVIIPVIEKEVNEGENFAQVRQIYASMIMASWFKKTLKQSLLGQVYADKDKVVGIEVDDPQAKEKIYQQYVEAYKTGVFNYIKEEVDPVTNEMLPRKYFSGGFVPGLAIDPSQVSDERGARGVQSMMQKDFAEAVHVNFLTRMKDGAKDVFYAAKTVVNKVVSSPKTYILPILFTAMLWFTTHAGAINTEILDQQANKNAQLQTEHVMTLPDSSLTIIGEKQDFLGNGPDPDKADKINADIKELKTDKTMPSELREVKLDLLKAQLVQLKLPAKLQKQMDETIAKFADKVKKLEDKYKKTQAKWNPDVTTREGQQQRIENIKESSDYRNKNSKDFPKLNAEKEMWEASKKVIDSQAKVNEHTGENMKPEDLAKEQKELLKDKNTLEINKAKFNLSEAEFNLANGTGTEKEVQTANENLERVKKSQGITAEINREEKNHTKLIQDKTDQDKKTKEVFDRQDASNIEKTNVLEKDAKINRKIGISEAQIEFLKAQRELLNAPADTTAQNNFNTAKENLDKLEKSKIPAQKEAADYQSKHPITSDTSNKDRLHIEQRQIELKRDIQLDQNDSVYKQALVDGVDRTVAKQTRKIDDFTAERDAKQARIDLLLLGPEKVQSLMADVTTLNNAINVAKAKLAVDIAKANNEPPENIKDAKDALAKIERDIKNPSVRVNERSIDGTTISQPIYQALLGVEGIAKVIRIDNGSNPKRIHDYLKLWVSNPFDALKQIYTLETFPSTFKYIDNIQNKAKAYDGTIENLRVILNEFDQMSFSTLQAKAQEDKLAAGTGAIDNVVNDGTAIDNDVKAVTGEAVAWLGTIDAKSSVYEKAQTIIKDINDGKYADNLGQLLTDLKTFNEELNVFNEQGAAIGALQNELGIPTAPEISNIGKAPLTIGGSKLTGEPKKSVKQSVLGKESQPVEQPVVTEQPQQPSGNEPALMDKTKVDDQKADQKAAEETEKKNNWLRMLLGGAAVLAAGGLLYEALKGRGSEQGAKPGAKQGPEKVIKHKDPLIDQEQLDKFKYSPTEYTEILEQLKAAKLIADEKKKGINIKTWVSKQRNSKRIGLAQELLKDPRIWDGFVKTLASIEVPLTPKLMKAIQDSKLEDVEEFKDLKTVPLMLLVEFWALANSKSAQPEYERMASFLSELFDSLPEDLGDINVSRDKDKRINAKQAAWVAGLVARYAPRKTVPQNQEAVKQDAAPAVGNAAAPEDANIEPALEKVVEPAAEENVISSEEVAPEVVAAGEETGTGSQEDPVSIRIPGFQKTVEAFIPLAGVVNAKEGSASEAEQAIAAMFEGGDQVSNFWAAVDLLKAPGADKGTQAYNEMVDAVKGAEKRTLLLAAMGIALLTPDVIERIANDRKTFQGFAPKTNALADGLNTMEFSTLLLAAEEFVAWYKGLDEEKQKQFESQYKSLRYAQLLWSNPKIVAAMGIAWMPLKSLENMAVGEDLTRIFSEEDLKNNQFARALATMEFPALLSAVEDFLVMYDGLDEAGQKQFAGEQRNLTYVQFLWTNPKAESELPADFDAQWDAEADITDAEFTPVDREEALTPEQEQEDDLDRILREQIQAVQMVSSVPLEAEDRNTVAQWVRAGMTGEADESGFDVLDLKTRWELINKYLGHLETANANKEEIEAVQGLRVYLAKDIAKQAWIDADVQAKGIYTSWNDGIKAAVLDAMMNMPDVKLAFEKQEAIIAKKADKNTLSVVLSLQELRDEEARLSARAKAGVGEADAVSFAEDRPADNAPAPVVRELSKGQADLITFLTAYTPEGMKQFINGIPAGYNDQSLNKYLEPFRTDINVAIPGGVIVQAIQQAENSKVKPNHRDTNKEIDSATWKDIKDVFGVKDAAENLGGIDLSDDHLTINIKVDGQGMPLPMQFQDPAMTDIQGLSPIIREIAPVSPANIPVISELLKMGATPSA